MWIDLQLGILEEFRDQASLGTPPKGGTRIPYGFSRYHHLTDVASTAHSGLATVQDLADRIRHLRSENKTVPEIAETLSTTIGMVKYAIKCLNLPNRRSGPRTYPDVRGVPPDALTTDRKPGRRLRATDGRIYGSVREASEALRVSMTIVRRRIAQGAIRELPPLTHVQAVTMSQASV